MMEIALIENLQREDLNPLEEAEGYRQMMELFGYSTRKLAERVGKTRSYIQHRLRICAPRRRSSNWCGSGPIPCAMWLR